MVMLFCQFIVTLHNLCKAATNMKSIFRSMTWAIFLDMSIILASRNSVADHPTKHHLQQDKVSDGWPMEEHHQVTEETMNHVKLNGHHRDELMDEELKILLPLLIKNTHYRITSKKRTKGSKKKNGRRGQWKQLSKLHPELDNIFGDKNPLVENHKPDGKLLIATEKHFHHIKYPKSSSVKKDTVTNTAYSALGVIHQPNYDEMSPKITNEKVKLAEPSNPMLQPLSNSRQNHITSPNANLNTLQQTVILSSNHPSGRHGNHKASSTESSASQTNHLNDAATEVESTYISSETTLELIKRPEVMCNCENGGSCVLRVVCVCPKEYYGTRCQHKLHHNSCRDVRHGTWIRHGCTLCRCQDGNMLCMTQDIGDCDEAFDEEEVIQDLEKHEDDRMETYILPPPTPSLDLEVEVIDSDILVLEFKKKHFSSKANSSSSISLMLIFGCAIFLFL